MVPTPRVSSHDLKQKSKIASLLCILYYKPMGIIMFKRYIYLTKYDLTISTLYHTTNGIHT